MRSNSISDFPRNEAGLVGEFIGTAYDTVRRVYHSLPEIQRLDGVLAEIPVLAEQVTQAALDEAFPIFELKVDTALADAMVIANQAVSNATAQAVAAEASAVRAEDAANSIESITGADGANRILFNRGMVYDPGTIGHELKLVAGFALPVNYAVDVVLTRGNEIVIRNGTEYRVKDPTTLPYTLTGVWATDSAHLLPMADMQLRADLLGPDGSSLLGYRYDVSSPARPLDQRLKDSVSIMDFGPFAAVTCNLALQAAVDTGKAVYVPAGLYPIDAKVGIKLRTGTTIYGAGMNSTIFQCIDGGGTLTQLRDFGQGRVFGRSLNISGPNSYVSDVLLQDFAVILKHPATSYTSTDIQLGIDLRCITGSTCLRVFCGNTPPPGGLLPDNPAAKTYWLQGFNFACGSLGGSDPAYCGGEKNRILYCKAYGAWHNITVDDEYLSPASAAYATEVISCDIQTGHVLLQQANRYGAGCVFEHNILQGVRRKTDDANPSSVLVISGYSNYVKTDYVEAGSNCDRLVTLGSLSKTNHVIFNLASVTVGGAIVDSGSFNRLEYLENTGVYPTGYQSGGYPVKLYDNQEDMWVSFDGTTGTAGADLPVFAGRGILRVRKIGTGDYDIFFKRAFKLDNTYNLTWSMQTNASVHPGATFVRTYGKNSVRINTYINSTQADPLRVWVGIHQ